MHKSRFLLPVLLLLAFFISYAVVHLYLIEKHAQLLALNSNRARLLETTKEKLITSISFLEHVPSNEEDIIKLFSAWDLPLSLPVQDSEANNLSAIPYLEANLHMAQEAKQLQIHITDTGVNLTTLSRILRPGLLTPSLKGQLLRLHTHQTQLVASVARRVSILEVFYTDSAPSRANQEAAEFGHFYLPWKKLNNWYKDLGAQSE